MRTKKTPCRNKITRLSFSDKRHLQFKATYNMLFSIYYMEVKKKAL